MPTPTLIPVAPSKMEEKEVAMKVTIDLGSWWHAIRRVWWTYCMPTLDRSRCWGCGRHLTVAEHEHYGQNCERCEGIDYARQDRSL
jgi:hypothetical protein